jgi:twitching motility protein PilT
MLAESLRGVLAQRLMRRKDGRGRALALEVLISNNAVASLIREKKTFQLPSVIQTGKREGMQTMDESVLALVRDGSVDADEAAVHLSSRDLLPGAQPGAPSAGLRAA